MIYCVPETRLTAHPDFMASMEENTVTLPNENTEEEPMAPVGRRSDNRRSVSSRYGPGGMFQTVKIVLTKSAKLFRLYL